MNRVRNKLSLIWKNLKITHYEKIGSTNDSVKEYLIQNPTKEILIISDKQTNGRGRSNRQFYSEIDMGVYFSLGIKVDNIHPNELPLYTIAAATAMVEAIKEELGLDLQVKWVNDLFFQGRKVGGILAETVINSKTNRIHHLVVGIGLNIAGSFTAADAKTQATAGTLYEKIPEEFNREALLIAFLQKFKNYHENITARSFIPIYRKHLLGLNQEITYQKENSKHSGRIIGINDNGQLMIQNENNQLEILLANEIHFSSQQFVQE